MIKIEAISSSRYNGGVKAKRLYGSSTITTFLVGVVGQSEPYTEVTVGGPTPGERKTLAIVKYRAMKGLV
jgi:hypothetical protein